MDVTEEEVRMGCVTPWSDCSQWARQSVLFVLRMIFIYPLAGLRRGGECDVYTVFRGLDSCLYFS